MILDEEYPPDVRVEKEIRALQDVGHVVHLLCYSLNGLTGTETLSGIEIHRIPISKLNYKFKALALLFPFYFSFWKKAIVALLEKETYDIIHFHDLNLAKVCLEAGKEKGIPVIGDYHENRPEIMKYYHHVQSFPGKWLISPDAWGKFQQRYSSQLNHLILVTDEARTYYATHYGVPAAKITVVENFPEVDELLNYEINNTVQQKYAGRKMLLYFGDTGLRRGTGTIIEAAKQLRNDPEYCFVIIGDSREQAKLLKLKEGNKLDNLELTGAMPIQEAVSYFSAAYAGLCPLLRNIHHDTTYANKLFQYMAFGLPAIVSNCTAQETVIMKSECGLVHAAGNAADLVDKILLLKDEELYSQMHRNAAEAVKINYNFNLSGQKLKTLYDQIANEI